MLAKKEKAMVCKQCGDCKCTKVDDIPDMPIGLMNPHFKWVASKDTNVQATWRKHGWIPPSELKAKHESSS